MLWTIEDDDRLLNLMLDGVPMGTVARMLNRTVRSVDTRLHRLCSRHPAVAAYRGGNTDRTGLPLTDIDRAVLATAVEERSMMRNAHRACHVAPLLRRTVAEVERIMDAVAAMCPDQRAGFGIGNSDRLLQRARQIRKYLENRYGFGRADAED